MPHILHLKKIITAEELEKKAFGESPESGRTPAQRENELEAEYMDDLRKSVFRRHEQMCTELLTTGKILMKHYSNGDDAAKGINYSLKYLQFFENEFGNKYNFEKRFGDMSASEKILEFYKMAAILRKRGTRATDIVMAHDVSRILMTNKDFLEFYDLAKVDFGDIKQSELPEGVACNGRININGVVMTMFTYDEYYEDLDGQEKAMLPAGTIAFLQPKWVKQYMHRLHFIQKAGSNHMQRKLSQDLLVQKGIMRQKYRYFPVQYHIPMIGTAGL